VRSDLLPAEYTEALSTLQDKVEPFDTRLAQDILRRELGWSKYQSLVPNANIRAPVASASIGQVYKVPHAFSSHDGTTTSVAVKIQRPSVLAEIALDLYLGREYGPQLYEWLFPGTVTERDARAICTEWGRGLIGELDYRDEARNTIRFNTEMQLRKLDSVVMAPTVVTEYCTEQILVTEWVDGTRIDQSSSHDIPRLCAVALNAYLVMLLEMQTLHCDPHPVRFVIRRHFLALSLAHVRRPFCLLIQGNLLRTTDGKLCILDFGMTLSLSPDIQYSLLEFVAHLTSGDYDHLADDLVSLGFMSADKVDFVKRSGILEPMIYFMKQAGQGGGAANMKDRIMADYRTKYPNYTDEQLTEALRVELEQQVIDLVQKESLASGISMEMEELQRLHRDSFRMPAWFLYASRAFMTLEGISLQSDPNFSLIKNCFPYIAKRLLADEDPRAKRALQNMIYGATNTVDPKRLTE
jgi:predicted unusual protein kinase regulating ubiquinone biosynthesis (AarF/ABC1/UbiB family)